MEHFNRLRLRGGFSVYYQALIFLILVFSLSASAIAESDNKDEKSPDVKKSGFVDFLKNGEFKINLRYRFEYVNDGTTTSTGNDARASTLRTSLSYRSRPFHGFAGFIEFENISVPGKSDSYNNKGAGHLWNGVGDHPVVADMKLTEVNQVYLDVTAIPDTVIRAGREEIILDNVRFVGNVGWRQNHQSFDTVSVVNKSIPRTTITYAHLFKANRIFGDSKPMNGNLLNAAVQVCDSARLAAYAYLLDYDNPGDFGMTSNTFGFRLSGARRVHEEWNVLYDAEYAKQLDGGNNPNNVDADYYRLEGGVSLDDALTFKAGHEVLEGSPDEGQFNTPLSTLHVWNGWADMFLVTPAGGLRDTYFSLGGKYGRFGINGIFHLFRSDTGAIDYGKEADLLFTYSSPWKQLFGFKTAFYRADSYSGDTDKIMIYTAYSF